MRKRDTVFLLTLGLFVLLSRSIGGETSPLLWDAGSFHLAATDYDISQDRPHLPGYFLHIQVVNFFRLFLNPDLANLAPSVFWSVCGILLFYMLLRSFAEERESFFAALLLATNPMFWFFGSVSEIYAFDLFFSVALVWSGLGGQVAHTRLGLRGAAIYSTPLLMAFAAGVRQSSPILLLPLYALLWYYAFRNGHVEWKKFFAWHGVGIIGLFAWFVPMIAASGGWDAYMKLYDTHNPILKASPLQNIVVMASYALYTLPAFALLGAFLLFQRKKHPFRKKDRLISSKDHANHAVAPSVGTPSAWVYAIWIGVPLMFFTIVLYGKGYALLCLAALPMMFIPAMKNLPSFVLSGLVILQCCVYLIPSYRVPDIMIWQRGGNATEKAFMRSSSVYSLTQSHITTLNAFQDQVNSALAMHSAPYIFVDPTFPLLPRVLQARHPSLRFASMLVHDSGLVQVYDGINLSHSKDLSGILDSSLVLTTQQCRTQYFSTTMKPPIWQRDELVLCQPLKSVKNAESPARTYQRLFVR